jgi:hypothetical protein
LTGYIVRIALTELDTLILDVLTLSQYAALPLMVAIILALAVAFLMRETYPR